MAFKLYAPYRPTGDQPQAIEKLTEGVRKGYRFQTLIGVTGSGKTFTIANVIANVGKPTLVLAPNKTLAAQLYREFKDFFPENAVEYFVSYYDYYQPEAYIPEKDLYIEKDADINKELERLRHAATCALMTRRDVIIVASVSAIYALGSPKAYRETTLLLTVGKRISRKQIISRLVELQYERNDFELASGRFRVRGDVIEVIPAYEDTAIRIELWGDEVERLSRVDPLTGNVLKKLDYAVIYPATHYLTEKGRRDSAIASILAELEERYNELKRMGKLVEAERLRTRVLYDVEMIQEMGYCKGIENYSRHFDGRKPGEPPYTLLDYFPEDFLVIIDESHLSVPQLQGMYRGDRSRKEKLVEYGFRLPSAFDNRPLKFEEFLERVKQVIFVSATPGPFELKVSEQVVEQLVRPTGLLDPEVEVRPTKGQIEDLLSEIRKRRGRGERVIVTTLTKRTAEDLADFLKYHGIRAMYLHSDIDAIERARIIKDLRAGRYDVLVGINLLREGLDMPEVSLVAILEADKEGFLRSETSLIQVMGRAARNVNGKVIMYADRITDAMKRAIEETNRRRRIQMEYNRKHGITPQTVKKEVKSLIEVFEAVKSRKRRTYEALVEKYSDEELQKLIMQLEEEMLQAAAQLEFEEAARIRDRLFELKELLRKRKTAA